MFTKDSLSQIHVVVTPFSVLIDVPVLVAVGGNDELLCGGLASPDCSSDETVLAHESLYYLGAPCLDAYVLPEAGHSLALHPDAPDFQDAVAAWTAGVFGGGAACPG
ncbi:MAG: hypothetical protein ACRDXX_12960 [Stackebrandtia sp.]